jgi:hypothetical protein
MSDGERRAMGRRAREYVAANYDRVALADRYLGILTDLAKTKGTKVIEN